jgi:hypothetical protein
MSASTATRHAEATRVAERATGAPLRRGARARASTDAIVPSRAGYPTATLVSWEPGTKLQSNYHRRPTSPGTSATTPWRPR